MCVCGVGRGGHQQPPDSRHLEPPLDRLTLAKDNLPRSILLGKGVSGYPCKVNCQRNIRDKKPL